MALGPVLSNSLSRNSNRHFETPVRHSAGSYSPANLSKNLNRLLSAAVVSPYFRNLLLSDPGAALAAGYNGEQFQLTPVEYTAVTSLQVATIRDFAAELLRILQYSTAEAVHCEAEAPAGFRPAEVAT